MLLCSLQTGVAAENRLGRRQKEVKSTSTGESVQVTITEEQGADLKSVGSAESVTVSTTVVKSSKIVGESTATKTIPAFEGASNSPAVQPRRAGEVPVGGLLSAALPSSTVSSSPQEQQMSAVRPPSVMPVHRRDDRLAKITSAGPVYRASPVMRPRAGTFGMPPTRRSRDVSIGRSPSEEPQHSLTQRLVRKLEVKPHQSPRRSAIQVQQESLRKIDEPTSPLTLGSKTLGEVPELDLDEQQSQNVPTTKTTRARAVSAKKRSGKRCHVGETAPAQIGANTSVPRRRPLGRKVKRSTYRETDGSSSSENELDDDRDEDVNPSDFDLPEEATKIYVPARERATMWAKSILCNDEEDKDGYDLEEADPSRAIVLRAKKSGRKLPSKPKALSVSSALTGIGSSMISRYKMEELMKKEPSEMTMGELALTVPKGKRIKLHEREEAAMDTSLPGGLSGRESSNLLNLDALNRIRSLSVSSEAAAFAGSLVTPRVRIVDGEMVVLENTIKLGDELQHTVDSLGEESVGGGTSGLPPRHSGSRYATTCSKGPGRRWGKEETKQFYYCLSQVGPNFSMMATLFPTRKRKELKSKFKSEEKNHARLIDIALRASTAPLDSEMVDVISQMVDREAQQKQGAVKKKRKSSLQLNSGQGSDTASVSTPMTISPMSTPRGDTEEFVETLNDEDLFPLNRLATPCSCERVQARTTGRRKKVTRNCKETNEQCFLMHTNNTATPQPC
uniref:Myb-like domain-containing protein n=1 Tax=Hyaloperonospora arabidopsidis (strain Emoy2) TaxID=559515 RepID=M4BCK7_HYAAE